MEEVDLLIIGAGPTGLAAAFRLQEVNFKGSWLLIEASDTPGGLAKTHQTKEGFLFDIGGHVIFSHFDYFDELIQGSVGKFTDETKWEKHQRESYIRFKEKWIPYPFQNNLCKLSVEDQINAINGLIDANSTQNSQPPKNFDDWIVKTMGVGIANMFMRPYNYKVWACPPTEMTSSWLGERVAMIDFKRAIQNILRNQIDISWGPNAVFHFPKFGGTGSIWKKVAERIDLNKIRYGTSLKNVDFDSRVVTIQENMKEEEEGHIRKIRFKKMISSIPIDSLMGFQQDIHHDFRHASTHVIGLGVRGNNPHETKCWLYFPENNCPFYRATIFSNYSKYNVPDSNHLLPTISKSKDWREGNEYENIDDKEKLSGPYWSIMLEVSESIDYKQVNEGTILKDCIFGAINAGLLKGEDEIVSVHYKRFEYGYPVPFLQRDNVLSDYQSWLRGKGIYSRGRFASFKYEVSNQDHCVSLGIECIDHILFGKEEITLEYPQLVNKGNKVPYPSTNEMKQSFSTSLPEKNEFFVGQDRFKTHIKYLQRRWFANSVEFTTFMKFMQQS